MALLLGGWKSMTQLGHTQFLLPLAPQGEQLTSKIQLIERK